MELAAAAAERLLEDWISCWSFRMAAAEGNKRKTTPKRRAAQLPAGVKVVPAPRSAARRALLSGADVAASGGGRTVHSHPVGR
jgi:hypothetical protein